MEITSLSLLCLFLLTFLSSFFLKKIKSWRWKLPPSPSKLPIIGNLHQLGETELPHRSLHVLSKKHGPVMLLHLGFSPLVVISSKEAAEEVLKIHDLETCSRPDLSGTRKLSRDYRDVGFTPYGVEWRERRKLAVRELFSLKKVQSFGYIREEECNLLVKKLSESAFKQSQVNLSKTLFSLTSSIIFRVVFGQNFHESDLIDENRIEDLVFEAETVLASFTCSDFFPGTVGFVIDWLTGQHERLNKVFVEMDTIFQKVIDEHMKPGRTGQEHRDIIDVMLSMIQKQGENDSLKLSVDHIKGFLANVFLAGIDTSAITMIWAMTELVRNPKLMKKLQDQIRGCLGDNKQTITEQDLGKVDFLKLVIKETFRLHPAAPLLLPRQTMAHIKIQGYDIPPNTRLQINAWSIGQDDEIWTNPQEFMPERFLGSSVDYRGHNFELLPFGSGRRMCPGMAMGIATVELGLLNLLYFFDWRLPDGIDVKDVDVEEAGTLTIVKKVPLMLVPVLHR